jgi:hypothetical protein
MEKNYFVRSMIYPALVRKLLFFIFLSSILWSIYIFSTQYILLLTKEVLHNDAQSNGWISWIYDLYPRLETEKWRFSEAFFFGKVKQLMLRMAMTLQIITALYIFRSFIKLPLQATYHRLMDVTLQRKFIFYMTLTLYSCLLLVVYNTIIEFQALQFFSPFYKPVGIGKLLLPVFPSTMMLWCLYAVLLVSIFSVVILPKKWIAASVAALAFIYYQLILFGFSKYDHGYSTLTYALLIYPIFLWEAKQTKEKTVSAWSIVLIQWMICLSYFYSGLEKISTSGIDWFYSNNLQQHLLMHETRLGLKLASSPILCQYLSFGVLLLEWSFILLPFQKKLAYIILPAGFIFHCATWILLDAGGLFNPWWGVYLFFLFPLSPQETK